MSEDIKRAEHQLTHGGSFGGGGGMVFDGRSVRKMTKEEKDAVAAQREATKAGGSPSVTIGQMVEETAKKDASKNASKS